MASRISHGLEQSLLFVVFLKSGKLRTFVGGKIALIECVSDFCHHIVVEIQIVQNTETHAEHLFCFQQMTDISSGVSLAGRTVAALFDGSAIQFVFGIEQINLSMVGI